MKPALGLLKPFTICAHRGASGELPENTIKAFQRAIDIDPEILLEMDVWPTRDKEVIVFHDADLATSTDGQGAPCDRTLAEIRSLDAGYRFTADNGQTFPFRGKGYRIAMLREVLAAFPGALLSIDIKHNSLAFASQVMKLLETHQAHTRVFAGSFFSGVMDFVRKNFPAVTLSYDRKELVRFLLYHKLHLASWYRKKSDVMMIPEFSHPAEPAAEPRFFPFSQGIRIITKRFVKDAHRHGIPVIVWTINRPEDMKRLIDWGVDGIVTDYPERLREISTLKPSISNL